MTRRVVYGLGLWVTIAATALTLTSILLPRWLSYHPSEHTSYTYGLHKKCSSLPSTGTSCTPFPAHTDCEASKRNFCSLWKATGFLLNFAVIIELATAIAYVVVILGGKQKRDGGWKILSGILGVGALVQIVGMAIVAYLFSNDPRFIPGWNLDTSFVLCNVSWGLLALSAAGLISAAIFLPEEGGYELIPN